MKFVNLLTNEKKEIKLNDIIKVNKNNLDFIISNPHSGIYFPNKYIDNLIINEWLFISSDIYTDEVYDIGKNSGTQIYSLVSRYISNLNKNLFDKPIMGQTYLDKSPSFKKKISKKEQEKIIKRFYFPYHTKLGNLIREMKDKNEFALVIEGHSMNSVGYAKTSDKDIRPDFAIGTRLDSSCEKEISNYLCLQLNQQFSGLKVWKNKILQGGFITRSYGRPAVKTNVIQIELKRALYEDEKTFEKNNKNLQELNKILLTAIRNTAEFTKEFYKR